MIVLLLLLKILVCTAAMRDDCQLFRLRSKEDPAGLQGEKRALLSEKDEGSYARGTTFIHRQLPLPVSVSRSDRGSASGLVKLFPSKPALNGIRLLLPFSCPVQSLHALTCINPSQPTRPGKRYGAVEHDPESLSYVPYCRGKPMLWV